MPFKSVAYVPPLAFEEAEKNAPAIIFIDELDAIAPKRDKVGVAGLVDVVSSCHHCTSYLPRLTERWNVALSRNC